MRPSLILRAAQHHRTPMIKFLGKRKPPQTIDHTPHVHPASPSSTLPDSFANYRSNSQTHGPMGSGAQTKSQVPPASGDHNQPLPKQPTSGPSIYGAIGGTPGRNLGPIEPDSGEVFDRNQLPPRFRKLEWTEAEIEAVGSGGASMWF